MLALALRKNKISYLETTDNTVCQLEVRLKNLRTCRKHLVIVAINIMYIICYTDVQRFTLN